MRNHAHVSVLLNELEFKDGEFYRNGKLIRQCKAGKGKYLKVEIQKDGIRYRSFSHVLIFALHYGIDELKKHEAIDHINGDKYDNRIENLQGLTWFENSQKDSGGKLSTDDAKRIKFLLNEGFTGTAIAKSFGVSATTISKINRGLRFKNV
jgi:hypothetical protein